MKPRRRRMIFVVVLILGLSASVSLVLAALNENLNHFYSPAQVVAGEAPLDRTIRVGGMVVVGSFSREPNSLNVTFSLTDTAEEVQVAYAGILPDLFREGQGIIAKGHMNPDGGFVAREVLAKHDENYMPPEVADAIEQAHRARGQEYGG